MANIVIEDLDMSEELDRKAMEKVIGGWFMSHHSSMGFWSTPWGSGGSMSSSTSMGSGWGNPWGGGGWGNPWGGGGWGNPWGGGGWGNPWGGGGW